MVLLYLLFKVKVHQVLLVGSDFATFLVGNRSKTKEYSDLTVPDASVTTVLILFSFNLLII